MSRVRGNDYSMQKQGSNVLPLKSGVKFPLIDKTTGTKIAWCLVWPAESLDFTDSTL